MNVCVCGGEVIYLYIYIFEREGGEGFIGLIFLGDMLFLKIQSNACDEGSLQMLLISKHRNGADPIMLRGHYNQT